MGIIAINQSQYVDTMGQTPTRIPASNPNSIIIRQNKYSSFGSAPSWLNVAPTPQLQSQGLGAQDLKFIVQNINYNAEQTFSAYFNPYWWFLVFIPALFVPAGMLVFMLGES